MKGSRNSLYWIYIVLLIILFFIYHTKDGPEWISLFEIWFSIKGTSEEGEGEESGVGGGEFVGWRRV